MSNKNLSERIDAGLDRQNDLTGYESHANAEGIINTLNNELNTKMMTGEELTEDDIKAINTVSKAFDIDPEQFTHDYLEGMEAQGHDISSLQDKINSATGANNNVGASSDVKTDTKREKRRSRTIEDIELIKSEVKEPMQRLKHLAEYTLNNANLFGNDEEVLRSIDKEARVIKKDLRKRKQKIPNSYNIFFYFLKHGELPEQKPKREERQEYSHDGRPLLSTKVRDGKKKKSKKKKSKKNGYEHQQQQIHQNNIRLQPTDIIQQLSGADIGTPEYMATKEMIGELQDINSTKRVNKNLKYLAWFGGAGMFLSLVIGIMGFHYDITYHFPFMETVLPSWIIWVFAIFGTGLIMATVHIPLDSIVNRKYLKVSRNLLGVLLLFGIPLKVYIDYKAIVNYSKQVAEAKRQDSLKDKTKVLGSSLANVQRAKGNQEKNLDRIEKQLDTYQEQLKSVLAKKKPLEDKVSRIENSKPTRNRGTIKWRKDNLREANKALEKLDRRQMSIQNHIDNLQKQQNEYMGVITKNTNKLNGLLAQSEQTASTEADARFKMMGAMLFLIELASMLKIYSEFIRNKNTPITMESLNKINTFLDAGETIDALGNQLSEALNRGNMAKGTQLQNMVNHQIYGQISTEQGIIRNTQDLLQLSQENTKQSMELIGDMIVGQKAQISNEKMRRQLEYYKGGNDE